MIRIDQALCLGCGVCVQACPTGAITLSEGKALVNRARCDGCRTCIEVCPNAALAWVADPVPESVAQPSALTVVEPAVEVIPRETSEIEPWRRAVLPAVGGALAWVGREIVPRLAPLALNVLDSTLGRWTQSRETRPASRGVKRASGRQRRRRHRRGRSG